MDKLPSRIYRCSACDYTTERRFVLKNHLINVHGLSKRNAFEVACESEYWLNPRYVRADSYDEEDIDE